MSFVCDAGLCSFGFSCSCLNYNRLRYVKSVVVSSRLVSSCLVSSRLVSSRLTSSLLVLSLVFSCIVSSRIVLCRFVSSRLASSGLLQSCGDAVRSLVFGFGQFGSCRVLSCLFGLELPNSADSAKVKIVLRFVDVDWTGITLSLKRSILEVIFFAAVYSFFVTFDRVSSLLI